MEKSKLSNYIFIGLLIVIAFLVIKMILPYFTYMLLGLIFIVALQPVYLALKKRLKSSRISSFLTIILVILIIIIPSFFIVGALVRETTGFFSSIDTTSIGRINDFITEKLGQRIDLQSKVVDFLGNIQDFLLKSALQIAGSVADVFIGMFIMFSIMYYGFIEGKLLMKKIQAIIPFSAERKNKLTCRISIVTRSVIYGQIAVSIIQGILGAVGFMIIGIPNPVLWGFVMAVLAFLPFVSSGMVWFPAGVIMLVNHNTFAGIFIFIYGFLVVGGIDYVLRPKIISKSSCIHPLSALVGVFGGMKLFGFPGIIIGPMIVALLTAILAFYYEDYMEKPLAKKDNKSNSNKRARKKS